MTENGLPPFALPAVHRKKATAAVDGGRITPDGGGGAAGRGRAAAGADDHAFEAAVLYAIGASRTVAIFVV